MSAEFDALSSLPGHLQSFTASASDARIINDTGDSAREAKTAQQLIIDATELAQSVPALQDERLKSITVTFQKQYHSYTVVNNTIYGVQRENDE